MTPSQKPQDGGAADEKNASLTVTLKARSGYRAASRADISPNQWLAINHIIDGDVDAQAVLALAAREAQP